MTGNDGTGERRRRWATLVLTVLGALLAVLVPVAPAAAATCTSREMFVVAHEDDDLLFISPDLLHATTSGVCVTTVYVTAGDRGAGQTYWRGREQGENAAYAQMAGVANTWSQSTTSANGHAITTFTLTGNPNVRQVFLRLPDGNTNGSGFGTYGSQSLQKLWSGSIRTMQPVDESAGYTRQGLIDTLAALMTTLQPSVIHALDYVGALGDGDHSDHHVSAYFARQAHLSYTTAHTFTGYEGYGTSGKPQNVFGADLSAKKAAFYTYGQYDSRVCVSDQDCVGTGYDAWLPRQYTVGSETGGGNRAPVASAGTDQVVTRARRGNSTGRRTDARQAPKALEPTTPATRPT